MPKKSKLKTLKEKVENTFVELEEMCGVIQCSDIESKEKKCQELDS